MPTVLVPLNETAFAESILPDAEQLAGPGGRFVLVYVLARRGRGDDQSSEAGDVERYLSNEAQVLQARGFQATTKVLLGGDIPRAIDEGVTELGAEMVAVATHGTAHGGRLARSSIAWKTLAHSPVPILLRHAQEGQVRDLDESGPQPVTILVPLDGSSRAEQALPVAATLAAQWQGSLVLVQIDSEATGGQEYLDRIARDMKVPVQAALGHGRASEALAKLAADRAITHVVMTSHGRTGLSRVIAGDVAAGMIDRLALPIVVIPSLAEPAQKPEQNTSDQAAGESVSERTRGTGMEATG
jgi:nucleotide-binding universal stress UspA family protein